MSDVSYGRRWLPLLVLLCVGLSPWSAMAKQVSGYIEKVVIYPGALQVKAKIDTGALNTSLHCTSCDQTFERDGKEWVRFSVTNWRGESIELERPVIGRTAITRHFGKSQDRLVISLPVCLGGVLKEREVNVVDRSNFNYQMLIGRNFLAGDFVVDPDAKYLLSPDCPDAAPSH